MRFYRTIAPPGLPICGECQCLWSCEDGSPNTTADWCESLTCSCHTEAFAREYAAQLVWQQEDRLADIEGDELELQYRYGYL